LACSQKGPSGRAIDGRVNRKLLYFPLSWGTGKKKSKLLQITKDPRMRTGILRKDPNRAVLFEPRGATRLEHFAKVPGGGTMSDGTLGKNARPTRSRGKRSSSQKTSSHRQIRSRRTWPCQVDRKEGGDVDDLSKGSRKKGRASSKGNGLFPLPPVEIHGPRGVQNITTKSALG